MLNKILSFKYLNRIGWNSFKQNKKVSISAVDRKLYTTSWDKPPKRQNEAPTYLQLLVNQIHANPNVLKKIEDINNLMHKKGLMNSNDEDEILGPLQMIKFLMDKDLRTNMNCLKVELEKAGIVIGPEHLGSLMTVLGIRKKCR